MSEYEKMKLAFAVFHAAVVEVKLLGDPAHKKIYAALSHEEQIHMTVFESGTSSRFLITQDEFNRNYAIATILIR